MREHRESSVMFRLKSFLFKHRTIVDMYHFLSDCAASIGQASHFVYLYDHKSEKYTTIDFCMPEQHEAVVKYLNMYYRTIHRIELKFNAKAKNSNRVIPYTLMFDKHTHTYSNATIELSFNDVHMCGLKLNFYFEELQQDLLRGHQPKPSDDFVILSFEAYDLVKEWMNALQAEECWGGDSTEWFEPQYEGYHYRSCPFRFRSNGPQYVDISLEDRKHYLRGDVEEQIIQELRGRGLTEEVCNKYDQWPFGRVIDATWDEYYQMMKDGIKLPRRYVDEKELYDNPDALFADIDVRVAAHKELQSKLRSGEYNFNDGFMTVD